MRDHDRKKEEQWLILSIGRDLLAGAKAEIRGGPSLLGYRPAQVNGWPAPSNLRLDWEDHAIILCMPDGKVHMYLFPSHQRARFMYNEAVRLTERAEDG